jgi:hypothetical protein
VWGGGGGERAWITNEFFLRNWVVPKKKYFIPIIIYQYYLLKSESAEGQSGSDKVDIFVVVVVIFIH